MKYMNRYREISDVFYSLYGSIESIASKYSQYGTSTNPLTSFNDVPDGAEGNCTLDATLSPTGAVTWFSFKKYGRQTSSSNGRYTILLTGVTGSIIGRVWVGTVKDGVFGGWTEITTENMLMLGSSVGGSVAKTFGVLIGNGSLGESELREYYGSGGFYYLNYTTKGTEYGYENANGNRTVYWNTVREFKYTMPNDTELPTTDVVKSAISGKGSGTYVVTFCRQSDNEARSAMIYTAASNAYGGGLLFTYYNSSWYKVKNTANTVTLTAF